MSLFYRILFLLFGFVGVLKDNFFIIQASHFFIENNIISALKPPSAPSAQINYYENEQNRDVLYIISKTLPFLDCFHQSEAVYTCTPHITVPAKVQVAEMCLFPKFDYHSKFNHKCT